MFDLDNFVYHDFTQNPLSNVDIDMLTEDKNAANSLKVLSSRYTELIYTLYGNTHFCNDGRHYRMPAYPVSDYALENLLYAQSFSYSESGPAFFTVRDNAKSYQIIFTYDGQGELTYEDRVYRLGPGDGIFLDCSKKSSYHTAGTSWTHCVLHFYGRTAGYYYDLYQKNGNLQFHQPTGGQFQEMLDRIVHHMHLPTVFRDADVSNSIENVLIYLVRSTDNHRITGADVPQSMHAIVDYIYSHYTEDVHLDELSDISSYNKYYMCRIFKKYFGMSPRDYIIHLRILKAKELLRDTDISIQDISDMVGIGDLNYFYRLYRARTGISPASYRKSIR